MGRKPRKALKLLDINMLFKDIDTYMVHGHDELKECAETLDRELKIRKNNNNWNRVEWQGSGREML